MKKLWIIIASCAVCGIILMAVGFTLGADTNFIIKDSVMNTAETAAQISQKNTSQITQIDIDVLSADIEIIQGDFYGYEINLHPRSKISHRFENGALRIEQEPRWSPFNWFPFSHVKNGTIRVFLPASSRLDSLNLETLSGSVTVRGFNALELEVSTKSGEIQLREIEAAHIDLDVTSGNITLKNVSADNFELGIASGRFNAENFSALNSFDADIVSGRVTLAGSLLGQTNIKVISGSVTLNLDGKRSDYNTKFTSVSGLISINGSKTGSSSESFNAPNNLVVHTTSGAISIYFKN